MVISNSTFSRSIRRRISRQIFVGDVPIGGDALISVQSMTNTLTSDVEATVTQIRRLKDVGADIVRVSCPDQESTLALKNIICQVQLPIVADIHFNYKRAIEAAKSGVACLRINPGNIRSTNHICEIIRAAKDYGCSIRIGVNAGNLDKKLLKLYGEPCPNSITESALNYVHIFEDNDFFNFKISVKTSDVFLTIASYQNLSKVCDYPLHIGITEAGSLCSGTVKSALGIGSLLLDGIGDTIRVSLSADPIEEIKVGYEILKSLKLRNRGICVISCPSCARQCFNVIKTVATIEDRLSHITKSITLSIIGCVVNGLGEARNADLGLIGSVDGKHMVYIAGNFNHKIETDNIVEHIISLVENKIMLIQN
ncbi:MAG: flavodoxin-dependent (E)-4-hydroxy-3-methylbut-2-enyl-diphosphate synthase [Rhodospirillaceae bacterium]|jgi:(E)-4-hydroxy-3-methylbut-2-enyl-diphosphate synthase|nr:flavodoxin-dependent (E)-4-hydroxy-3-methylbut-2-enyl-diphosphate synthase [Rhodospirillaceae bacterium]